MLNLELFNTFSSMLKIYIIGLCILIIAILANALILKVGIKSWYDFIALLSNDGLASFKKLNILDVFWLFIGYPMVLGFGYIIGSKIHTFLFN